MLLIVPYWLLSTINKGDNMSLKRILTAIVLLSVVILCIFLVACTPTYTIHNISYIFDKGANHDLKPAIISSVKELNDYFSQEDYLIKSEEFNEETKAFNDEFFANSILVPAYYAKELHVFKGVRVKDNVLEITIQHKTGLLPDMMPTLRFFEFDKKVAKGATLAKIVN